MPVLPYRGVWPTIGKDVFIAPGAMVIGNVVLEEGVSIWYNAVLRGDSANIVVRRHSNIQDNCTLHVDAGAPIEIGEECTIGHNAVVHGATLGARVLVGMNAVVLSHARIDAETIIGASALVGEGKHIQGHVLALGMPARVARSLNENELLVLELSARHYAELAQEYRAEEASGNTSSSS
ncbi:gamma carbonic anhydrase family protein [Dictyobacter kobayashii]|uniref:Gamma carbonic anhydrase family protein n=1 Tax=Dictyobacter kobayashii TaxID=2014872 RepID=A0A402AG01_9CHLR|nr:gamma carbonic anhydrase family protein [Dictyobacter kobayashii]GCE18041.1 gamma carbonic anhydrase family protein [Dictyobacter kobayashii]